MPKKPEWTPENSGEEFASRVIDGVVNNDHNNDNVKSNREISLDEYYDGIINSDRAVLAQAISLIESNSEKHTSKAQSLLQKIIPLTGNSLRLGITGAPGAGKSTFIDSFGSFLIQKNFKVAVLAIDPSSSVTKGSILGDKTRMEELSREKNAFIRPSPSGNNLGGVARKTRETILLLEAAGYDIILIETVGVGQSEIVVRSMVDMFILLLLPGEGDELQGIKKGTVELADLLLINKNDGENQNAVMITKSQYEQALHYISHATEGWNTKVLALSAVEKKGYDEIYHCIDEFRENTKSSGIFEKRRNTQLIDWFYSDLENKLKDHFYKNLEIQKRLTLSKTEILNGKITPITASDELIHTYLKLIK